MIPGLQVKLEIKGLIGSTSYGFALSAENNTFVGLNIPFLS